MGRNVNCARAAQPSRADSSFAFFLFGDAQKTRAFSPKGKIQNFRFGGALHVTVLIFPRRKMHDGNLSRKYFLVSAYFLRSAAFFVSRGGLDFRCLFAPG